MVRKSPSLPLLLALCVSLSFGSLQAFKRYTNPLAVAPPHVAPFALWQAQVGFRVSALAARIPTVDRVVVVPDEATFLSALCQWSLDGRWPILLADDRYTPMFIERFQPAEVIFVPSVKQSLASGRRQAMQSAIAAAWDTPNPEVLGQRWQALGWEPPGVVITAEADSAALGAVTLAAAWGQPLRFLEGDFGSPNRSLSPEQWQRLQAAVEQVVKETGYAYSQLGDAIDTVTLVRQLAVKYHPSENAEDQLAVTDGLARHANGDRWAIVGWIYGSAPRAVYQAMCSIFLDVESALLYNSYPPQSPWQQYAMDSAAQQLADLGVDVTLLQPPEAGLKTWRSLADPAWEFDLIFVNSRGGKAAFDVSQGQATVEDIPKLNVPAAIYFIHSWSATAPEDANTVAGRWLKNGAYAYIGSVHEPYLSAFVPPKFVVENLSLSVPFLIAARQPNAPAWKVTTIGDPLMLIRQPRPRISPQALPLEPHESQSHS